MAGYTPLGMPIALIQERIYNTGRRLRKWKPLEKVVVAPRSALITHADQIRRIEGISPQPSIMTIFEARPMLRRIFYLIGNTTTVCRGCEKVAKTAMDQAWHEANCRKLINNTIASLCNDEKCVCCQKELDEGIQQFWITRIPVCSANCLKAWDHCNLPDFLSARKVEELLLKAGD